MIQSNVPITTILNGGEYGLQVSGWGMNAWQQDARVQKQSVMTNPFSINGSIYNVNTNGMSWPRYVSGRKAHELGFLTSAIQQSFPNRELYIFYKNDNEQNRGYNPSDLHWMDSFDGWGWWSDFMATNTDLPSFEAYYAADGMWTNTANADLLTQHLNAVGYNIHLGYKTNYTWVSGGWGVDNQPDTNYPASFSDTPHYTGFLKCLYTAGMNGAIAGYFSYPVGGFDVAFPSNSPPSWLQQIISLSQVHALFSQLETFTDNSDLISGPQHHALSYDQPAYEFTNTMADATARVLARQLRSSNQWLITAWAAAGADRTVTVTIPTLGSVSVLARACGSVYQATTTNLTLIDKNGLLPTITIGLASPPGLHTVPGGTN